MPMDALGLNPIGRSYRPVFWKLYKPKVTAVQW